MSPLALPLPPAVVVELHRRGVVPASLPEESREACDDRLDTELMALFRDTGAREVFEELYARSRDRVFTWLRWLLHEQQAKLDPVDLLQDTYVNVYRYSSNFRSDHPGSFRVWVRTIAANVVRRAKAGTPRRWQTGSDALTPDLIDLACGPALRAVHGEDSERLRFAWILFLQHYAAAFQALAPRDRRALELVEVEGLSYAETGRELGVGPSNMKMIMLRARRRLHARMRASMCLGHAAAQRPLKATA